MRDPHQSLFDELAAEGDLQFRAEDQQRLSLPAGYMPVESGMDVHNSGYGIIVFSNLPRCRVNKEDTVTGVDFSLQMTRYAHRNFPFIDVNPTSVASAK